MKRNTLVLLARLALASFSPAKREMPRRLRITEWQTDFWKKNIIQLQRHPDKRSENSSDASKL